MPSIVILNRINDEGETVTHVFANLTKQDIERARRVIAEYDGIDPDDVDIWEPGIEDFDQVMDIYADAG